MKIALCVPETPHLNIARNTVPLNLGYLASYIRENADVEVRIFDGLIGYPVEKLIFQFQPDIVGITATTPQVPSAYKLAHSIRINRPDIHTVMGGVHASAVPEEAKQYVDCVVVGEGEKALLDIVKSKIKPHGVIYSEAIDNLDEIPMPAYDLMDIKTYNCFATGVFPNITPPIFGIITSRGCPHRCAFCYNSYRNTKPRWFSAERVIEEIEFVMKRYGVRTIFMQDDDFTTNRKRLAKLHELFIEHNLPNRLEWGCQARVEFMTMDNIRIIKEMGCCLVSSGIEHAVQPILSYLKTHASVERNRKAIENADRAGLFYGGGFVFGSPNETEKDRQKVVDFFMENDMKWIGLNTLIPYPATKVWVDAKKAGLLPENVDYERLIPSPDARNTYLVNSSLNRKRYERFLIDTARLAWIVTQLRIEPSFKNLVKQMRTLVFWYVVIKHPKRMFQIIKRVVKRRKHFYAN